jgi:hypothetical protein
MRSMAMPRRSHQTASQIEEGVRTGERHPIVRTNGLGEPAVSEEPLEGGNGDFLAGGLEGFAHEQEAGGLVGDGEGIAVAAVAELELTLEVGAPQIVGRQGP